jgi:hypothetical protein
LRQNAAWLLDRRAVVGHRRWARFAGAAAGIAAGVLNATRQTGSVPGVGLFGSLAGQADAFMAGARQSLLISAGLLFAAATVIWRGASN